MLRQDDYTKSQLVTVGWLYGKEYGGHLASCMIMSCIANRQRIGWGSWLEVIERVPNSAAEVLELKEFPSIWEPGFVRLLHEVDGIYDNSGEDRSKGALYWADLRRIERPWFQEKIIDAVNDLGEKLHPRVADLNSLTFFR